MLWLSNYVCSRWNSQTRIKPRVYNDKSEYVRGEIEAKPKVHSDKWILRAF